MALQDDVDAFIAGAAKMAQAAVAFVGEATADDTARSNIRRMRAACASLQAALEQANMWASMPRPPGS